VTIPVYILAGGRSTRFGSDKALADIQGRPMIARVAEQWSAWASRTTVVADRQGKYEALGLRTLADGQPGLGPMGGLQTALAHCGQGWLLLTACDTVLQDASLSERLLEQMKDDVSVLAFKGAQWETMPALYHCSLRPVVQAHLDGNQRSLWRLIEQVPHRAIPYPPDRSPLIHIDTQEDWRQFQSRPQA
jgi:molybdenum cofactor guanylyltransferase